MEHYFKIPFVLLNTNDEEVNTYDLNIESLDYLLECINNVLTLIKDENETFDNNFLFFAKPKHKKILNNINKILLLEDDFDDESLCLYFMVNTEKNINLSVVQEFLYYIISEILETQFERIKIFNIFNENLSIDHSFEYMPYSVYCKISFVNLIPSQIIEFKY